MSDLRTFTVQVTQTLDVVLDVSKFDEAFMAEFRESFYPFTTIGEHAQHVAQLQARGLIDVSYDSDDFIEGYGPARGMQISARVTDIEIEIVALASPTTAPQS